MKVLLEAGADPHRHEGRAATSGLTTAASMTAPRLIGIG